MPQPSHSVLLMLVAALAVSDRLMLAETFSPEAALEEMPDSRAEKSILNNHDHCRATPTVEIDFAKIDRTFPEEYGIFLVDAEQLATPVHVELQTLIYDQIPPEILALVGKRVRVHGDMFPQYRETGLKEFCLVGDCRRPISMWGPVWERSGPFLSLWVTLTDGTTTNQRQGAVVVEGKFEILRQTIGGVEYIVFELRDADVRSVERRSGYYSVSLFGGC